MDILLWTGVFVVSLALLIKSSDYFIEYSERIGLALGLSPLVIGTLILALGTSLPELVTSVLSVLEGASEIVTGNVVGSNIANIFLVGGILMIAAKKPDFHPRSFKNELWIVPMVSFILLAILFDKEVAIYESIVLLVLLAGYIWLSLRGPAMNEIEEELKETVEQEGIKWFYWLIMLGGAAGIYVGAEFTVKSIVRLSDILNIGKDVISLSAVALGTSLPELVVTVVSARKGNNDMAIGNILGSNIFNILAIISIPSFLGPIVVTDSVLIISIPVMILAALMFVFSLMARRFSVWFGVVLVLLYVLYNIELFSGIFSGLFLS